MLSSAQTFTLALAVKCLRLTSRLTTDRSWISTVTPVCENFSARAVADEGVQHVY